MSEEILINGKKITELSDMFFEYCELKKENEELRQVRKNSPDIQEPYIYLYRQIKEQYHKLEEENEGLKSLNDFNVQKIEVLQEENEKLKKTINRLQKDCERNNDLYMKERDKNYKLSEISKEYNARRCIEKLYRLICDDTKSVQETYITLKDEVSEFLRIHKTMSSKYEEVKQTYKQALEEIRKEYTNSIFYQCDKTEAECPCHNCIILGQLDRVQNIIKIIDEVLNDRD